VCDVTHLGKVAEARLFQEVRAGKSRRGPEEQMVPGEKESQFDFVEGFQVASLINKSSKTSVEGQFAWCCMQSFFFLAPYQAFCSGNLSPNGGYERIKT